MKEQINKLKLLIADYESIGDVLTAEMLKIDLEQLEIKEIDEE